MDQYKEGIGNPFDAPVPGQSLTDTPGNNHREHPPQITDTSEDADDDALNLLCHALVAGCEVIFGEDLSEEDEHEYGMEFWHVLSNHPDVAAKLNQVATGMKMGSHDPERSNTAPPMTRDEIVEIVVTLFRESGSGELREEEFLDVMEDVKDNYDRLESIAKEVDRLCGLSLEELHDLYHDYFDIIEHNYNHLLN